MYFDAKTFLNGLLVVEDKLSMAHALETRAPFLDNDLVDFAQRLPISCKLGNLGAAFRLGETGRYSERTNDGKLLLRKAMEHYVPKPQTEAVKRGFLGPDASWYRGEIAGYVRKTLCSGDPRLYSFLDRKTVHGLVDDHLSGRANHRLLIWSLLYLENWCRIFLSD